MLADVGGPGWLTGSAPPLVAQRVRNRIRYERERCELSQVQVAEKMSALGAPLTGDMVCKIETGTRSVKAEELFTFARVFAVPVEDLYVSSW